MCWRLPNLRLTHFYITAHSQKHHVHETARQKPPAHVRACHCQTDLSELHKLNPNVV